MIIGHKRQLQYLEQIIKSKKVPHAFIFSGPDHLGKRLVAESFFAKLVGINNLPNIHPDILIVEKEEKNEISIKQIRELKKFVGLSPFHFSKKFVLIDNAHEMRKESFNSLLKTLEEPAPETFIIMVTSNLDIFPKTIISRSSILKFNNLTNLDIAKAVKAEGGGIEDTDWPWIAGRPGLALRYIRDPKDNLVADIKNNFFSFLDVLDNKTIFERFNLAQQVYSADNLTVIVEAWILAAYYALAQSPSLSSYFSKILCNLSLLRQTLSKTNTNKRLQIENALLDL